MSKCPVLVFSFVLLLVVGCSKSDKVSEYDENPSSSNAAASSSVPSDLPVDDSDFDYDSDQSMSVADVVAWATHVNEVHEGVLASGCEDKPVYGSSLVLLTPAMFSRCSLSLSDSQDLLKVRAVNLHYTLSGIPEISKSRYMLSAAEGKLSGMSDGKVKTEFNKTPAGLIVGVLVVVGQ
jgi:hypothetical protein